MAHETLNTQRDHLHRQLKMELKNRALQNSGRRVQGSDGPSGCTELSIPQQHSEQKTYKQELQEEIDNWLNE